MLANLLLFQVPNECLRRVEPNPRGQFLREGFKQVDPQFLSASIRASGVGLSLSRRASGFGLSLSRRASSLGLAQRPDGYSQAQSGDHG